MSNDGTDNDSYTQKVIDGAQGAKDVFAGAKRQPFDYTKVVPDFVNGEHVDNPGGGPTVNIDAKAGDNKGSAAGEIEFIHFGRVYIDVDSKFAHDGELDDEQNLDLATIVGGRGAMQRAALMRECQLIAGYLNAIKLAMEEAGKVPPTNADGDQTTDGVAMLGQAMGMVGDLVGGDAAGALNASALDLNPLVAKCNTIGSQLNQAKITYPLLHWAGRQMHDLRVDYQAFLDSQVNIEQSPDKKPDALLGGIPFLGEYLKEIPFVGDALEYGDKILGCSFQLVGRLTLELYLKMHTTINAAVREVSLDALRERRAPIYYPWWKYPPPPPPPPDGDDEAPDSGGMSIDFVEMAQEAVKDETAAIDREVKEYTSLFRREDESTPGDKFIEMAFFLNPQGSPLDQSEKMGTFGGQALARVIAGDEGEDTKLFDMPELVTKIASHIFQLVSEFVRAVYEKLLVIGPRWFTKAEIVEAGRTHLVKELTDWPLEALGINEYIDYLEPIEIPSLSGGDPTVISARNLFENLRDKLIAQLGFMDVAVEFAMGSFYDLLLDTRRDLGRSMEAYIALIPTLHATMFRNLLLPFWGAMQKAVKGALANVMGPVLEQLGVGGAFGDIHTAIDDVQQVAQRVQEVQDFLGKEGSRGAEDLAELEDLFSDPTEGDAKGDFGNQGGDVGKASPFGSRRERKVTTAEITQADRDAVAPDLKWNPDADVNEEGAEEEPDAAVYASDDDGSNDGGAS